MSPNEIHWTAYITAFAVPLTAAIAVYIAFQQWQTARRKLMLDLFDRRYAVYEAANNLIEAFTSPKPARREDSIESNYEFNDQVVEWLKKMQVADWLVSNEVEDFLDLIAKHAWTLHHTEYVIQSGRTTDEERDMAMEQQQEAHTWLKENHHRLRKEFTPYLSLQH